MTIEQGLVAELLADSGVSAVVGTKVHPGAIPQGQSLPAIVYNRISTPRDVALGGPVNVVGIRFRIDCWHTSYASVKALAAAVRSALNGLAFSSPRQLGSEPVDAVYLVEEQDLAVYDGDQRDHRVTQDWIIVATET